MPMVTRIALCATLLALAALTSGQLVPSVEPAFTETPESQAESLGVSGSGDGGKRWTSAVEGGAAAPPTGRRQPGRRQHPHSGFFSGPLLPPTPLHPLPQNTTVLLQQGIPQFTVWSDVNSSCTEGAGGQQTCAPQHWLAVALRNVYEVDSSGTPVAEVPPPPPCSCPCAGPCGVLLLALTGRCCHCCCWLAAGCCRNMPLTALHPPSCADPAAPPSFTPCSGAAQRCWRLQWPSGPPV